MCHLSQANKFVIVNEAGNEFINFDRFDHPYIAIDVQNGKLFWTKEDAQKHANDIANYEPGDSNFEDQNWQIWKVRISVEKVEKIS